MALSLIFAFVATVSVWLEKVYLSFLLLLAICRVVLFICLCGKLVHLLLTWQVQPCSPDSGEH